MSKLSDHIGTISRRLQGYGALHPASFGRVIMLDPPYHLPEGMDLRGIAGVVLRRRQNPEAKALLAGFSDEERTALSRHEGRFDGKDFLQKAPSGPRPPAPFSPPEAMKEELRELSAAFQRLTGVAENSVYFPRNPAPEFHIDGSAGVHPFWRLTYAFNGPQTLWHTYRRDADTPVVPRGMVGFPLIPPDKIGSGGEDYFESEGALMFLADSPNGLFHRTPDNAGSDRFIVTMDARTPRRADCSVGCPFPCRNF